MTDKKVQRRLSTILAADAVGYSCLMVANEEATLRTLKARREVIYDLVTSHNGRVFGSAGDSVIAEFPSPPEAVRCAIEIQRSFEKRNAGLREDSVMCFRIGISLAQK